MFGTETISLTQDDNPHSHGCLWSHFDQGTLISQDCMLALEAAPGKVRELDWEGKYSLLLVHIYTFLSVALVLSILAHVRKQHRSALKRRVSDFIEITPSGVEVLSNYDALQRYPLDDNAAYGDTRIERICKTKRLCLVYLAVSCVVGLVSSTASETVHFSDFLDGLCVVLLGFLALNFLPLAAPATPSSCNDIDKRHWIHYKKLSSLDIT